MERRKEERRKGDRRKYGPSKVELIAGWLVLLGCVWVAAGFGMMFGVAAGLIVLGKLTLVLGVLLAIAKT